MSGERGESSVFLVFDYAELDLLEVIRCTKNRSNGMDNRDLGYGRCIGRRVRAIAMMGAHRLHREQQNSPSEHVIKSLTWQVHFPSAL